MQLISYASVSLKTAVGGGRDKSHCSEDPSRRGLSKVLSLSIAPFSSFFTVPVYLHLEYQAQNISEENNSILVNKQMDLIAGRTPPQTKLQYMHFLY